MRNVCLVVPEFPPRSGGVADYTARIREELIATGNYAVDVVCCRERPSDAADEAGVSWIGEANRKKLEKILREFRGDVVLQCSAYGFQKRGVPLWLASVLKHFRKTNSHARLVTMFHELGGSGPITTSGFWLSPAQWWTLTTIAKMSDQCITNRSAYARFLAKATGRDVPSLPVFSHAGEPDAVPPISGRKRRLLVFGSKSWRERAFREDNAAMAKACRALRLSEILNVGEATQLIPEQVEQIPVRNSGWVAKDELSQLFRESVAGYFSYPVDFLGKSTIFSSYCANGTVPVGAAPNIPAGEGLSVSGHYLLAEILPDHLADGELQVISDKVRAWYHPHRVAAHVELYKQVLSGR